MRKRHKELLAEIAFLIGDRYISDLHYNIFLHDIKKAIELINLDEYPLEQWSTAAQYIGSTKNKFNTIEEARRFILRL